MPKLSELPGNAEISYEGAGCAYEVAEIKAEALSKHGDWVRGKSWETIIRRKWKPDADGMIHQYIDNAAEELYEDAGDHLLDKLKKEHVERIQAILDEAYPDGLDYWEFDKVVEIDIDPKEADSK